MFKTAALALVAGSLLGVWFCWQQQHDEHLTNLYTCAHSREYANLSLEEAYISCEIALR
jgi:hypothetical protein